MAHDEITLKIDVFTPGTLPMSRLADYLKQFALMVGSEENVHFSNVGEGSAELHAMVEASAVSSVKARVQAIRDRTAPKPAVKAFDVMDELLLEDNAIGELFIGTSKVIEIPGRRRAAVEEMGPVRRTASIDGQIFSIGGRDQTINVQLRDGERELRCVVSIELARRLAPHLFGEKLRLHGYGNWYRIDSLWQMRTFERSRSGRRCAWASAPEMVKKG